MPEDQPTEEGPIVKASDGGVTVSIKTGTLIAIFGGLLGTGGGAGVMQLLNQPNPQLEARIKALEAVHVKHESSDREHALEVQKRLDTIEEVANETYKIVDAAHPPRGRFGVPDVDDSDR